MHPWKSLFPPENHREAPCCSLSGTSTLIHSLHIITANVHLNFGIALLSLSVFVSSDLRWTSNLKTTPRWAALHNNKKPLPWPLTRGQVWGSEWYLLMKLWAPNLLHSVRIIQLSAQTGISQHDGPRHGPSIIYELHRKQPGDNREAPRLPRDYPAARLKRSEREPAKGHCGPHWYGAAGMSTITAVPYSEGGPRRDPSLWRTLLWII